MVAALEPAAGSLDACLHSKLRAFAGGDEAHVAVDGVGLVKHVVDESVAEIIPCSNNEVVCWADAGVVEHCVALIVR